MPRKQGKQVMRIFNDLRPRTHILCASRAPPGSPRSPRRALASDPPAAFRRRRRQCAAERFARLPPMSRPRSKHDLKSGGASFFPPRGRGHDDCDNVMTSLYRQDYAFYEQRQGQLEQKRSPLGPRLRAAEC